MTKFRDYPGWEEDVRGLAERSNRRTRLDVPMTPADRLLAAFEPELCGKRLGYISNYNGGWFSFSDPTPGHADDVLCNLPKDHHPFVGDLQQCSLPIGEDSTSSGYYCYKFASDPIHSPVHGNTELEEFWR